MKTDDFYSEIEDIQNRLESVNNGQLDRELGYFVRTQPWQAPLIYWGLYSSGIGSSSTQAFFAKKTLDIVEEACDRKLLKKEPQTAGKLLDQLLISITILTFAFDTEVQRKVIDLIEQGVKRKIELSRPRYVDKIPLKNYLALLRHKLKQNEEALRPLTSFFDELIRYACSDKPALIKQRAAKFIKNIELMIEEAACKIEKPDRVFSYAESMDTTIGFAEFLFSPDKMKRKSTFNEYKWNYLRSKNVGDLRLFWVTCMVGLFTFSRSVDRFTESHSKKENVQVNLSSLQIKGTEKELPGKKKKTIKRITESTRNFFNDFWEKKLLHPVFTFKLLLYSIVKPGNCRRIRGCHRFHSRFVGG